MSAKSTKARTKQGVCELNHVLEADYDIASVGLLFCLSVNKIAQTVSDRLFVKQTGNDRIVHGWQNIVKYKIQSTPCMKDKALTL